jgi:signal transduction histidine kinase
MTREGKGKGPEDAGALSALASGLAHEIRNPLNSLSINSELLAEGVERLDGVPEERRRELLDLARANVKVARRLSDLLGDFLRFTRPAAADLVVTDLNRIASETLRFLEVDFGRRGISVEERLKPGPLPLFADEKRVKQALLNLLLNAQEAFDKPERRLRVETGSRGGCPFVRVSDNGRGIAERDLPSVFRPFFTTRPEGTGLGLAVVRKVARDHGGRVSLRSREGAGTSVTLLFPPEERSKATLRAARERSGNRFLPQPVGPR